MPQNPKLTDFIPKNLEITCPKKNLHHIFDKADCLALWAAYASGRPLLVRGHPGTGKSQLARAIAEQLNWAFVSEVIRGSTELSDLHWHFDAIGRLGEAQAMSYKKPQESETSNTTDPLHPINFLSPGVFWWAYDWQSANNQYGKSQTRLRPKTENAADAHHNGVVLLLDEIDKAEPDLPNGLLETLGHYQFTVPYINHAQEDSSIKNPITANPKKLLVVITTNEERELPTAFVRRCFVHTLKMEDQPDKRIDWLKTRGKLHFKDSLSDAIYQQAAEMLWADRDTHSRYPPGLAEYIDLLTALTALEPKEREQRLTEIACYALNKEVKL